MLDTNIVSEFARNPQGAAAKRAREVDPSKICVSVITASELRYGCAKKGSPKLAHNIEAILNSLKVLPFNEPADKAYGVIRAELESAGTPIGPNDLLIAAHAQANDAVLVTANLREFTRVHGLQVENWLY